MEVDLFQLHDQFNNKEKKKNLSALEILYFTINAAPYNCHSCIAHNNGSVQHAKNILTEPEKLSREK